MNEFQEVNEKDGRWNQREGLERKKEVQDVGRRKN